MSVERNNEKRCDFGIHYFSAKGSTRRGNVGPWVSNLKAIQSMKARVASFHRINLILLGQELPYLCLKIIQSLGIDQRQVGHQPLLLKKNYYCQVSKSIYQNRES